MLLASGSTAEAVRSSLRDLIDVVNHWSIANYLCINSTKCTTMCITPTKRKAIVSAQLAMPLQVNGSALNSVLTVKILGVVITSDLSWLEQARVVQSKILRKLSVLQRIGGTLMNTRARAQIYKTCIKPHLDYCLHLWAYCGPSRQNWTKQLCVPSKSSQTVAMPLLKNLILNNTAWRCSTI